LIGVIAIVDFFQKILGFFAQAFRKCAAFLGWHGVTIIVEDVPPTGKRFVVVDLEWNQYPKWARTPVSPSGVVMPHEIIQIGAVMVDEMFRVFDTFTVCIRLEGRRKLSRHVARVISKTQAEIDQGDPFPAAYAHFSDWCADAERFFTWGSDDFRVLQNNLSYYGLSPLDSHEWLDAQQIYARQVRGDRVQTALAKAAETLGVQRNVLYHDALNDAYITASVCTRLDMAKGMTEIHTLPPKSRSRQSESRLFMQKKFVSAGSESGFETRALAKQHCGSVPVACPVCGDAMKLESSRITSSDRWMRMGACQAHGKHLIRYRIRHKSDGTFGWTRAVYAQDRELETYYWDKVAQKQQRRSRRGKGKKEVADTVAAASPSS